MSLRKISAYMIFHDGHEDCYDKIAEYLNNDDDYQFSIESLNTCAPNYYDIEHAIEQISKCDKTIILIPRKKHDKLYEFQTIQALDKELKHSLESKVILVVCEGEVDDLNLSKLLAYYPSVNVRTRDYTKKIKELLINNVTVNSGSEYTCYHIPPHENYATREKDEKSVLDMLEHSKRVVGIKGFCGIGKSSLANAVVRKLKSNMHIYWVTVGQVTTPDLKVVEIINKMHKEFWGCSDVKFTKIEDAKEWLSCFCKAKKLLLVLDDVWDFAIADSFNVLGANCKILITFRDDGVIANFEGGEHVCYELRELDDDEARDLFSLKSNIPKFVFQQTTKSARDLKKYLNKIVTLLKGLPMALSLVASALYQEDGNPSLDLWQSISEAVRDQEDSPSSLDTSTDLDANNLMEEKYKSVLEASFKISFDALRQRTKRGKNVIPGFLGKNLSLIQEILLDFALFKEDVKVPFIVLKQLKPYDSEIVSDKVMFTCLDDLCRSSLLTKFVNEANVSSYTIHALLLAFVKKKARELLGRDWEKRRHRTLLFCIETKHLQISNSIQICNSIQKKLRKTFHRYTPESVNYFVSSIGCKVRNHMPCRKWWEIDSDNYFYNNLAHHLIKGGLSGELSKLLLCYEWIFKKVTKCNVTSLISDFELLKKERMSRGYFTVVHKLLLHTLYLSCTNIIGNELNLPKQLLGRLHSYPCYQLKRLLLDILKKTVFNLEEHCMIPLSPTLHSPGWYLRNEVFHFNEASITALAVFDDEVISGGNDCELREINPTSGEEKLFGELAGQINIDMYSNKRVGHVEMISAIGIDPQERFVISGDSSGKMLYWPRKSKNEDVRYIKPIPIVKHTDLVRSIEVSADGVYVVSGSSDTNLYVWKVEQDNPSKPLTFFRTLQAHTAEVRGLCITSDSRCIISVGADSRIVLWFLEDLDNKKELHNDDWQILHCVDFHTWQNESSVAITGGEDAKIRVFTVKNDVLEHPLNCFTKHTDEITALKILPEKEIFITVGKGGMLCVWPLDRLLEQSELKPIRFIKAHSFGTWCLALLKSENAILVLTGSAENSIKVWSNLDNPKNVDLQNYQPNHHTEAVTDIACSADGTFCVTVSRDGHVVLLDISKNQLKTVVVMDACTPLHAVVISGSKTDGLYSIFVGDGNGCISTFTYQYSRFCHFKYLEKIEAHKYSVCYMCLTPGDSLLFASFPDNIIKVFMVTLGRASGIRPWACLTCPFYMSRSLSVLKQHGDPLLVSCFLGGSVEWDIQKISQRGGSHLIPLRVKKIINDYTFPVVFCSRSKMFVVASDENHLLRQWRLQIRRQSTYDSRHDQDDVITCMITTQDEEYMIVGSEKGHLRILPGGGYREHKNTIVELNTEHTNSQVVAIQVSADMNAIFAGHADGNIFLFSSYNEDCSFGLLKNHCWKLYQLGSQDRLQFLELLKEWKPGDCQQCYILAYCSIKPILKYPSSLLIRKVFINKTESLAVNCVTTLLFNLPLAESVTSIVSNCYIQKESTQEKTQLFLGFANGDIKSYTLNYTEGNKSKTRLCMSSLILKNVCTVKYLLLSNMPEDNVYLVAGLQNNQINLYNSNMELIKTICTESSFDVRCLAIVENGKQLMVCFENFLAELYDIESEKRLKHMRTYRTNWMGLVYSFSSDGKRVIVNSTKSSAAMYDISTLPKSTFLTIPSVKYSCNKVLLKGHSRRITVVHWVRSSSVLTGSYDKCLKLWDVSKKKNPSVLCDYQFGHTVTAVKSTKQGQIIVGLETGQVNLLQLLKPKPKSLSRSASFHQRVNMNVLYLVTFIVFFLLICLTSYSMLT